MSLRGKTIFISGGSRGIGLAIALRAARDGANVTIAAKAAEPHPKLPGTIYTAAEEIEQAGGKALPVVCDIRDEAQVTAAVDATIEKFGGIDICINNASAINLTGTLETDPKRFDLMMGINTRGTFMTTRACLPYLKKSADPHVLTLSPPLSLEPRWFKNHVAYSIAKYGMSLCVLGMAEEFRDEGIAVNALWPRTVILTAALKMIPGLDHSCTRKPEIMADAAYAVFAKPAREFTGNFLIDDTFLSENGVTDFEPYRVDATQKLAQDFFVPADSTPPRGVTIEKPFG